MVPTVPNAPRLRPGWTQVSIWVSIILGLYDSPRTPRTRDKATNWPILCSLPFSRGLKISRASGLCGFDSHPRHRLLFSVPSPGHAETLRHTPNWHILVYLSEEDIRAWDERTSRSTTRLSKRPDA